VAVCRWRRRKEIVLARWREGRSILCKSGRIQTFACDFDFSRGLSALKDLQFKNSAPEGEITCKTP